METTTRLNPPALPGGDLMDETLVTQPISGLQAKRPNVVPGGTNGELQTFASEGGLVKADVKDESVLAELQKTGTWLPGHRTAVGTGVAVMILDDNPNRQMALLQNTGNANICIGPVGVTAVTGLRILPNAVFTYAPPLPVTNAIWAIGEVAASEAYGSEVV